MKWILLSGLLFVFTSLSAQLEDAQLDSLKKEWTAGLLQEMKALRIGEYNSGESVYPEGVFADSVRLAFEQDTFLLNGLYRLQAGADQTTFGMVRAAYDYEQGLDALLNKYYNLLVKALAKTDREKLRETQRNWIRFRDSERALSAMLTEERYSGGGTIQQLIYSSHYASLTTDRLHAIIDYLERIRPEWFNPF